MVSSIEGRSDDGVRRQSHRHLIVPGPATVKKRRNMTDDQRAHRPMSLQVIRDVVSSEYKGPRAIFSEVHVLRAILAIGTSGSGGRGRLGRLLGLGQGR